MANTVYQSSDLIQLLSTVEHHMKRMKALNELSPIAGVDIEFEDRDLVRTILSFAFVREVERKTDGVIKEFAHEAGIGYRRARRMNKLIKEETHLSRNGTVLYGPWPDEDSGTSILIEASDDTVSVQIGSEDVAESGIEEEGGGKSPDDPIDLSAEEDYKENYEEEGFTNEDFEFDEGGVSEGEVEEEVEFERDDSKIEDWAFNDDVMYVESKDEYIYYSDKARKNIRMPGEVVRELKTDYSNQGEYTNNALTINEIARKYEIPRKYVIELKKKFGWTHDSSIYTEEELVEWDTDQLDKRAVEARERKALERAQRKRSKDIEKKAKKWDDFYYNSLKPLVAAMREHSVVDPEVPKVNVSTKIDGPFAATFCPMDLHYGKSGWSLQLNGSGYSREEAEDALLSRTKGLIEKMKLYGPERIFVPIGHDLFHVTNKDHQTGHGTDQDVDGSYTQIVLEGCSLASNMVEMLRQLSIVDIVWVPGNHDPESSMTAAIYLAAKYEDAEDVNVHLRPGVRAYLKWENNLMGHIHGDAFKDERLVQVMANEVRSAWGETHNSMWFSGHKHSEKTKDVFGTHLFRAPTLAGKGRWDFKKGYSCRRSLDTYMIHAEDGKVGHHSEPLAEKQDPSLLVEV